MLIGGGEIDMGDLGDLHAAGGGQAPASSGLRSGKWELSPYQIRGIKHAFSGAYDCLNSAQYTWIPGNKKYIASVSSRQHKTRRSDPRFSSHFHTLITQNATSIFNLHPASGIVSSHRFSLGHARARHSRIHCYEFWLASSFSA